MLLVITLRKEVVDRDEGEMLYELAVAKFADRPDIKVTGHVSNHFPVEEPEP